MAPLGHMKTKLLAGLCILFAGPAAAYECAQLQGSDQPTEEYGRIVQGDDGWFFRTAADLTWRFYLGAEAQDYISRLQTTLDEKGTRLVFAVVPPRGLVEFENVPDNAEYRPILTPDEGRELYDDFLQRVAATGAQAPNLLASANALTLPFFFKRDHHWTPDGARLTAIAVADALRADETLEGLDSFQIETQSIAEQELKGGMARVISRFCSDVIPAETFTAYETSQQASNSDDLGLFSDPSDGADVVLLGTSFSDVRIFNFDGFLSEQLGVTVANHAISGGGFANSPISYFSSEGFAASPPDAIVWELPVYYDVSGSLLEFRQMLPAALGACAPGDAVASTSGDLSNSLEVGIDADRDVSGIGSYVYVSLDDPTLTALQIDVAYADGDRESVPIDRSGRFDHEGRFFLEFSPDISASVTNVRVSMDTLSHPISADLRVCRTLPHQQAG